MSATETRETIRLVERIARERGLTLLFTEHDMEVVFSIAQQITVLHQGQVIAHGTPAEVRNSFNWMSILEIFWAATSACTT